MNSGNKLLSVSGLVSGYGKLAILQSVSFDVLEREIVCVIGPNGSGKSTILKTVFGLTNIFGGSILFDGKNITGISPESLASMGISYAPQRENVFPNLNVIENLEIGAVTIGNDKSRKLEISRVFEHFPQLQALGKKKAGTLSGGERQMLAIGRALILQPRLLLLDEPTASLAPHLVADVLQRIRKIRETGVAVLIVEQNAREVLEISDRGVVIASGKKVFEGTPKEISDDADTIKLFLGAS